MSDLDDFLTPTLARQVEAEQALVNGDPGPRLAITSTQDPVTIFGAKVPLRRGWDEVSETLRWLASRWSDSTDYRFDLVAAGVNGDLAYLVGFEHIANSVLGIPVEPYTLRVTPHLPPRARRLEDRLPPRRPSPDRSDPSRRRIAGLSHQRRRW